MRYSIVAAVMAASAATAACGHNRSEDGGPDISRNYQVGGFDQIEVSGPYKVQVRTGANPSVSAQGSEKMIEHMVVEVRGGTLKIRTEKRKGLFNFGRDNHGEVNLVVTVPALRGASIAGSGDIAVNQVRGDSFDGGVAGSGSLKVDSVEVQQVQLSIGGSGEISIGSGKAKSSKIDIAGSGDIDARGLQSESAEVSIAGSGNVTANATGTADISIAGSGNVDLTGGAKCSIDRAGSGDVRCS